MRTLAALSLALATLVGASSAQAALTAPQAASRIKAAVKASPMVADKTGTFSSKLGPVVKGTKYVRSFTASNMREMTLPFGGPGAVKQGSFQVHGGGVASGKINLRTEKVTVTGYTMPR